MLDIITKGKITAIVEHYKRTHRADYNSVVQAIEGKRRLNADEFATVQGSGNEMRALFELPEDLHTDLIIGLAEDEMIEFKTKAGGRWFATTFREFALPESI